MATIRPFNALRPTANHAAQVAAVPYDVVNTEEARALAAGNPLSFLHVSRAEIDLPDHTPIYSDEVYAKAQSNFEKLSRECPLQVEEKASLYLYRLIMGDQEQIGVAGRRRDRQPRRDRAGDLGFLLQRRRQEGDAIAERRE